MTYSFGGYLLTVGVGTSKDVFHPVRKRPPNLRFKLDWLTAMT